MSCSAHPSGYPFYDYFSACQSSLSVCHFAWFPSLEHHRFLFVCPASHSRRRLSRFPQRLRSSGARHVALLAFPPPLSFPLPSATRTRGGARAIKIKSSVGRKSKRSVCAFSNERHARTVTTDKFETGQIVQIAHYIRALESP